MGISLLEKLNNRAWNLFNGKWAEQGEPIVATFGRELVDTSNNTVLTAAQAAVLARSASFTRQTASFTAAVGGTYGMDTTAGSITCTPPPTPNDGDWFRVFDVAKKWGTNQAVIGSGALNFIDKSNPGATAGPYDLNAVPYVGQGMITFVWNAALNVWSVN